MRFTVCLNSFRREFIGPIPKHKGNVLIGKKRFVPPVTLGKKLKLFRELYYEEEAMKYLSKSYITKEQEDNYLRLNNLPHPPYWDEFMHRPLEEPLKQFYAADYLQQLDISRSFQEED